MYNSLESNSIFPWIIRLYLHTEIFSLSIDLLSMDFHCTVCKNLHDAKHIRFQYIYLYGTKNFQQDHIFFSRAATAHIYRIIKAIFRGFCWHESVYGGVFGTFTSFFCSINNWQCDVKTGSLRRSMWTMLSLGPSCPTVTTSYVDLYLSQLDKYLISARFITLIAFRILRVNIDRTFQNKHRYGIVKNYEFRFLIYPREGLL